MCVPKIMNFDERLTEKITRGDNWPIASKPFISILLTYNSGIRIIF